MKKRLIKKIDADINKKIKNCRLYMAGIKQKNYWLYMAGIKQKNYRLYMAGIKQKNYRLYMTGIKQKQKCFIFIQIPSENQRLKGSKKFIRSGSKGRIIKKPSFW